MGKDPAVLFYTSDFLSGTAFFTKSQKGEYITLLCEQHQLWSIPENHLIEMCGSLDSPVVKKFIKDKDGTWYNLRMRTETIKRKKYSESRRKNIMNRYHENDKPLKNKRVKPPTYEGTSVLHMENENENRNDNVNTIAINTDRRECSELLKARILETRQQKITDKTLLNWDREVRLMVDVDGRSLNDIKFLINECHNMDPQPNTGFTWRNNILSMQKLRQQWNDGKIYIGMTKQKTPDNRFGPKTYTKEDFNRQMRMELP